MIFVKNSKILHVFILGKIGQEKVFYDILDTKNAFLDYKNIKLKKLIKRDLFVCHYICQKLAIFPSF